MAQRKAPVPPPPPRPIKHARHGTGSNGAQPPASAHLSLGFSLLRLAVPARLALAGAAALLLWLCVAWALA